MPWFTNRSDEEKRVLEERARDAHQLFSIRYAQKFGEQAAEELYRYYDGLLKSVVFDCEHSLESVERLCRLHALNVAGLAEEYDMPIGSLEQEYERVRLKQQKPDVKVLEYIPQFTYQNTRKLLNSLAKDPEDESGDP